MMEYENPKHDETTVGFTFNDAKFLCKAVKQKGVKAPLEF